jgi:hypothetical protein
MKEITEQQIRGITKKIGDAPAIPFYPQSFWDNESAVGYSGLTKREYFAGLAMQGLLTRVPNRHENEVYLGVLESKRIASEAVYMADALLAELEAEQEVGNGN